MIALLGLTIGEQWNLEDLAADCTNDGVWECFVAVKALNLTGGVGSPANAFALKEVDRFSAFVRTLCRSLTHWLRIR